MMQFHSRFLSLSLGLVAFSSLGFAQSGPNLVGLELLRQRMEISQSESRDRALRWAISRGYPITTNDGMSKTELVGFDFRPRVLETNNLAAADTLSTDEVWPGGSTGLNLTGAGNLLGIWDGGRVQTTHPEFGGRVTQRDGAVSTSGHATHVAGTMVAAGIDPLAKGMSFQSLLDAYDWNSDLTEMTTAAGNGLTISNHSYGFIAGWLNNYFGDGLWAWFGWTPISAVEDYQFGFYGTESRDADALVFNAQTYLPVIAAGNDRLQGPGTQPVTHYVFDPVTNGWVLSNAVRNRDGDANGFDSMSTGLKIAKNVLTVGSVTDIVGGWISAGGVVANSFSSRGPTDDGRVKPDIVANGNSLYSTIPTNAYGVSSGTSMASPNASGSLGLVVGHYRTLFGVRPWASTSKLLAIHTADEAGNAGPDYTFGWGLMNTAKAAQLVSADLFRGDSLFQRNLTNGSTWSRTVFVDGAQPLRATLVWTDPAGTPVAPALDPPNPMLVNDLDLRVTRPDGTVLLPYRLDRLNPSAVATLGDNTVDNVEQIRVASPPVGFYTITVTHKGALPAGGQNYSLALTGQVAPALTGLAVTPKRVAWNSPVSTTGTISLNTAAPKGGAVVTLASSNAAVTVPATATVPEGQTTATFNVLRSTVATPVDMTITGTYRSVSQNVVFTLSPAGNEAVFVSQLAPATLLMGEVRSVNVTMRNTGSTTWVGGAVNGYGIRSQNPVGNTTWGLQANWLSSLQSVAPGAERTFTFNITAPAVAGPYNFQWRMRQAGVSDFGEFSPNVVVNVASNPNDAQFVSQTAPATMTAGALATVTVVMRNSGSATWFGGPVNGYGLRSQNPANNTLWGTAGVWLGSTETIPNGSTRTFSFSIRAPLVPGTYPFQWQMRQASVGFFGQLSPNLNIVVQ